MNMRSLNIKKILIIVLVILTLGAAYKYYKKYKGADKLKVAQVVLKPEQELSDILNLTDAIQNGLNLKGFIAIENLSEQDYNISQFKVDVYSPANKMLIGEQTNSLQNDIVIKSKSITRLPITFNLNIINALALFKESGVIPQESTLWQVITHPAKYYDSTHLNRLKVTLKGFVEVEGFHLDIQQSQNLYPDA